MDGEIGRQRAELNKSIPGPGGVGGDRDLLYISERRAAQYLAPGVSSAL